jgi:hypothetical protein
VFRSSKGRRFDAADLLATAAGMVVGISLGFIAAGSVGRINRTRLKHAMGRLTLKGDTPRRWTEDEAERLEARVLDALSQDVVLARRPIRVSVLGMGLVELTGTVLHTAEIGVASDVVQRVSGIETVLNHLVVESPSRPSVPPVTGPNTPRAARG